MINQKRLVKTFTDLVKIDSPSGYEEKIGKELAKRLKKLGAKASIDRTGNVIGKFPGKGVPIMLNSHMDTVEPGRGIKPKIKGDKITSDGTTILGADAKAGVAALLEALASLKENKAKHLPIEVVFTVSEEVSLAGSKNLDYSKISAKRGFVFDGENQVNHLDISSPSWVFVDIAIYGRSAHAGLAPERGISAIQIASHIISNLKLGRIDPETTANIGLISGGSVRNAVPDFVEIKGEIRSRNPKTLESHMNHFREIVSSVWKNYPDANIEIGIETEVDGYLLEENHPMLLYAKEVLSQMNLEPVHQHIGGLTDSNIFREHGIDVVTVGTGAYLLHTKSEYALISQMIETAIFAEKAVQIID